MSVEVIRVVFADDHAALRGALKTALHSASDIEVVGEAANGTEAIALAERLAPAVIVLDLTMPELDGVAATKAIVGAGLASRVLVLATRAEEPYVAAVMAAGAAGYLLHTDADKDLVDAVRAVANGGRWVRPATPKPDSPLADREKYARLTERERDVLRLVGQGYSAPEIGERLFISPKTVDTYKQRIQEKLNFNHRSHYVQFALRLGLLTQY